MKAWEKYPLPEEEKRELINASLSSEALIIAFALCAIIVVSGIATGDWLYALGCSWWKSVLWALSSQNTVDAIVPAAGFLESAQETAAIQQAASAFDAPTAAQQAATLDAQALDVPSYLLTVIPVGIVVAFVFLAILLICSKIGERFSAAYQNSMRALRQGLNGELVRLPMRSVIPCMLLTGFAEELCFRFVLLNLAIAFFSLFVSSLGAQVIALIVVTLAFWLMHEQYRDPFSSLITICGGLLLGATYLITGWVLASMIAHALYNILEIAYEQRCVVKEKDYFSGKVPVDIITTMKADAQLLSKDDNDAR